MVVAPNGQDAFPFLHAVVDLPDLKPEDIGFVHTDGHQIVT